MKKTSWTPEILDGDIKTLLNLEHHTGIKTHLSRIRKFSLKTDHVLPEQEKH